MSLIAGLVDHARLLLHLLAEHVAHVARPAVNVEMETRIEQRSYGLGFQVGNSSNHHRAIHFIWTFVQKGETSSGARGNSRLEASTRNKMPGAHAKIWV